MTYSLSNLTALAAAAARGDRRALRQALDDINTQISNLDSTDFALINALTATATEINRTCDTSGRVVNATASTLAVTEATHDGKVITLNRAAGIAVTLPAATGSGTKLHFVVGTTVTSNTTTIKVTGDDTMKGLCIQAADGGSTSNVFETASDSDTITFDGSTTGGIVGDSVELIDIAADQWWVRITGAATGSEATPFSATVT